MTRAQINRIMIGHIIEYSKGILISIIKAVPLGILVALIVCFVIKHFENKGKLNMSAKRFKASILFAFYMTIIFQLVLLSRPIGTISEIDLIPFNTPGGTIYIIFYALANAIVFIPYGIFLPMIWKKMQNPKTCILTGLRTSVYIEMAQLILKCGVFQTEDMIMNTVGVAIGVWIWNKFE